MSENENIEAKLCSYVEGDLDPAGRAEIEKYLLANPQYRPLIAELSRTRGLLRKLPRESAPAELLETLSGQIERSALLGDDAGETAGSRSSRLPHLAAWAAVLMLTGGLAAVIYRVLPANKAQSELSLLKPAPMPAHEDQTSTNPAQKAFLDQDQVQAPAAPAGEPAPTGSPAAATGPVIGGDQVAAAPMSPAPAENNPTTAPTVASAVESGSMAANSAFAQQAMAGSIVSGDATQLGQNLYVTLRAADAKAADARVTQYLADNGIAFDTRPLDAGARVSAGPLQPPALSPSYAVASVNADSMIVTPRTQAVLSFGAVSTAPATSPVGVNSRVVNGRSTSSQTTEDVGQAPDSGWSPGARDTGRVIFARNLTADQAKRLTTDLDIKIPQPDIVAKLPMQPAALAQAPRAGAAPLQVGERVRLVARDNSLPGVEAMDEPQTIDADGNLTLPMVGKVKAAGLTASELAEKIPEVYHNANSPTTATWTIDRIASALPATEPALSLTAPMNAPASTAPAVALVATTSPAAAGNHGIDVTIRVIGQGSATTAPATEPVLPTDATSQNAVPPVPSAAPAATMPASVP
jgi:hypothetical protein